MPLNKETKPKGLIYAGAKIVCDKISFSLRNPNRNNERKKTLQGSEKTENKTVEKSEVTT